ncbi:MAG TPA: acetate--CoA ligase family protein [Limnochordia bacterium]
MRAFFAPRSVAVIGASRDPASIGNRILQALVTHHFNGPVYPVNPNATVVSSIRAYASIEEVPEPVDLAVIVVPRPAVLPVVDQCAACGVRALLVITAGFAETGPEGQTLQAELVDKARRHGMRMIGPNCLGLLNTDPSVRLNASFSPVFPPQGKVAMSSQSGALGLAILSYASEMGLGLSTFVSVGNAADVSGNDLLEYWEDDPNTEIILLYLESFGDPRRFAPLARRVARKKPIIAVKGGRTKAGRRAAGSHTAALATNDLAVDALFEQTGVIRAATLEEMFDLAFVLAHQPLPPGGRVAVLTNAGGPAILCTDACEGAGLTVPELSARTQSRLAAFLPPSASLANPVDMIASAGPEHYRQAIATLLADPDVDALIVLYIPVGLADSEAVRAAVREGIAAGREAGGRQKTVLACFMTEGESEQRLHFEEETIPTFHFPEAAAQALGRIARFARWRQTPEGRAPHFPDVDPERARQICQRVLATRGEGWLSADEVRAVLQAFHMPALPGGVARDPDSAAALAAKIGFPVAAKLASTTVVHKTEVGGVRLGLADEAAVRAAFAAIEQAMADRGRRAEMDGVLIQPMVPQGAEVMMGMTEDPTFGPLLAFGLGGVHVEVLGDVVFRVAPLTDRDAAHMIHEIRGHRLLEGYRGHPAADIAALTQALLRLSQLVEAVPELAELDMNPVIALPPPQGCRIVDARIRVAPPTPQARPQGASNGVLPS